ncbi:MAG: hypothetical protein IJN99_03055 [Clostridia bacterium]|nr:hypothetical protein [Clostridia bacterium]
MHKCIPYKGFAHKLCFGTGGACEIDLYTPTDLPDGKLISAAASVSAERSPPESSAPQRGRQ